MRARAALAVLALGVASIAVVALAAPGLGLVRGAEPAMLRRAPPNDASRRALASHAPRPPKVRWLAIGGGIDPASNQVSIEQDIALSARVLGRDGVVLFAGGAGRSPVQLIDDGNRPVVGLHRRLGELFYPRDGRVRYRPTTLALHGDGRAETVMAELAAALATPSVERLVVVVAAHGEPGKEPRDNLVRLWGGTPINVADLATALEEEATPRPLVLLMSTCFSGGFAELAFDGADPERGASAADRCGLFATSWDTEAAGCDPNPDRREQESYFLHVMHALEGKDRNGEPIGGLDLDGDGRVSLAEAHARARVASRSISVPTTTSERWLRHAAPEKGGDAAAYPWVEEELVIRALGAALELADAAAVAKKRAELEARAKDLEAELDEGEKALDIASAELRIALLERWPLLDDPYHPDYQTTLDAHADEIRRVLDRSQQAHDYALAVQRVNAASHALSELDVDYSMLVRLDRAHENKRLAAGLRALGGDDHARFERFLACERTVVSAR